MFTGIVADRGEIVKIDAGDADRRIWIKAALLDDCAIGGSVAVDGVCLTVAERDGDAVRFDVSAETITRSTLGERGAGDSVNLERPLRAGDELGGHIVQGHVDTVGKVIEIRPEGEGRRLVVEVPTDVTPYIVEKGSVTLDGVSLTVTNLRGPRFEVALIPQTLQVTTLADAGPGRRVNVEVDVLAKYAERQDRLAK